MALGLSYSVVVVVGGLTPGLSYSVVVVGGRDLAPPLFYLVVVVRGLTPGLSYFVVMVVVVGGRVSGPSGVWPISSSILWCWWVV